MGSKVGVSAPDKKPGFRDRLFGDKGFRSRMLTSLLSTPRLDQPDRLRRTLEQMILLRVTILSSFLGTAAWRIFSDGTDVSHLNRVCIFIATTFLISAINALALRVTKRPELVGYLQFFADMVLVSCTVVLSGSAMSHLLYLLVILGAAVTFQRHGAVIVAALSGISFAVIDSGVLPGVPGTAISTHPHEIFLAYVSFILIALVGASLAEKAQTFGRIAVAQAKDIDNLTQRQQALVNDSSEGIVMLDQTGRLISINNAARIIFGLTSVSADQLNGKPFAGLLRDLGLQGGEVLGKSGEFSDEERHLSLTHSNGGAEIHLAYILRPMALSHGEGKLLLFRDISRVKDMEEKLALHERMAQLLSDQNEPQTPHATSSSESPMVGESGAMHHVFSLVERVAQSDASILITGESGTGKELVARTIHMHGNRKGRPFVAINCGAIPENLIESELFGHKKGSFTGAVNDSVGLFRQANTGTLFLDEIGELPLALQTKLLRVLQERKVRAVGDVHDVPVDVRIIAATNRDLRKEINQGRFREDLFYRLNVVNILIPPLRERREDIPLLVRHFIGKYCDPDAVVPRISPEAIQLLMNHTFPGNIRELENIIERALVLGGHAILPEHLPEEVRISRSDRSHPDSDTSMPATRIVLLPLDLEAELSKLERDLLTRALETTGGMKKQAAELLGLNFRSFRYRLKKYGLSDSGGSDGDDDLRQE